MPAINRTIHLTAPTANLLLIRLSFRRPLATTSRSCSNKETQFWRPDFSSQGYSSSYEPGAPTVGPLAQSAKHGAPRLTPSLLKEHLDKFVVGQDKAKKVTSVAIYNHYQRIRELRRQEAQEAERRAQEERRLSAERERNGHPVENEFPGHVESVDLNYRSWSPAVDEPELGSIPLSSRLSDETVIEKSNLLLLGPSGVGKTYILSTLARVLEVPFATVDCSALTQAGYIGTDIESSIERLLLAAGNSVSKCETGIIFFDEVDKLAKPAVMTHGRDVSGEGVQQGLLKMIEGTTVTVNSKTDRNSKTESSNSRGMDRMERGGREAGSTHPGKTEQCTIDTSNILFVFAGAFVGLEKIINSRLSAGSSIGFGAPLKPPLATSPPHDSSPPSNPLDSVLQTDLQTYGLIPELLGRIPIITSLHPLSQSQLVSILTEPRNSLVKQYTALFNTYGIQLRFTTPALHAIAARALAAANPPHFPKDKPDVGTSGGIGARGLRSTLESVLGEIMFWGPGSGIRFCLVDEAFVRSQEDGRQDVHELGQGREKKEKRGNDKGLPPCWSRGQGRMFEDAFEKEEDAFRLREEERERRERGEGNHVQSFERYREVGGSGM